jgi:hypothetical protein
LAQSIQIWGSKKIYFSIFPGLGAALLHTGVIYYYFQEGLNTPIANGFPNKIFLPLNEGKIDTRCSNL